MAATPLRLISAPGLDAQAAQPVVHRDEQRDPDGVAAENIPLLFHGNPPVLAVIPV